MSNCAVILAAGEGKRMKSDKPKVLCEVLGRPMIDYVIDACRSSVSALCVVTGYKSDMVKSHLGEGITTAIQAERLGTGHAVMQAMDFIELHKDGNVLVLCGDAPLMNKETLEGGLKHHTDHDLAVTVISARVEDPTGYGRIVKENGKLKAIVEQKDADDITKAIDEVNSGAYWFRTEVLLALLPKLHNNNAQGEYYLTDTIKLALEEHLPCDAFAANSPDVVLGANDTEQLEQLNQKALKIFN